MGIEQRLASREEDEEGPLLDELSGKVKPEGHVPDTTQGFGLPLAQPNIAHAAVQVADRGELEAGGEGETQTVGFFNQPFFYRICISEQIHYIVI